MLNNFPMRSLQEEIMHQRATTWFGGMCIFDTRRHGGYWKVFTVYKSLMPSWIKISTLLKEHHAVSKRLKTCAKEIGMGYGNKEQSS